MVTEERSAGGNGGHQEQAAEGQTEGKYVYCIIESTEPRDFGPIGIGGRGDRVYTIHHDNLAAVVSDTPMVVYDPTRENALTHEHVNSTVMKEYTVIPMSFGTVFRTGGDVTEFLKDTIVALQDVLEKMENKIEFGLKVNWEPDQVLIEVEEEREDIRLLKAEIASNRLASTYFARMQLGRLVERAMSEKSENYVRDIYSYLRDHAIASRDSKPIGDKMILNAAFLVERDKTELFDQKVKELGETYEGKLKLVYSGPWPPYNFVNIRLKLERAGSSS